MIVIRNPFLLGFTLAVLESGINALLGINVLKPLIYFLPVGFLVGMLLEKPPAHGWYSFKVVATYTSIAGVIAGSIVIGSIGFRIAPILVSLGFLLLMGALSYLLFVLGQQIAGKAKHPKQDRK